MLGVATVVVAALVVVSAALIHGLDVAGLLGVGVVSAAIALWVAALVFLGPAVPALGDREAAPSQR